MRILNQTRRDPGFAWSFFRRFKNKTLYHRITFDVYILIYQLFMKDLLDTEGLLEGMEIMLKNWDCTQLITYLATNSCGEQTVSGRTRHRHSQETTVSEERDQRHH